VDAGRVDVGWRLAGDTFMMSWAERDGPSVLAPKRRGFGSTVVDSMAKLSVGAEVYADCILQLPISIRIVTMTKNRRPCRNTGV
jgi:two-component sensor histidine kinase